MVNDLRLLLFGSSLSCVVVTAMLGFSLPNEWTSFGLLTFGVLLEVAAFVRLAWELDSRARRHGEPGLLERLRLRKHTTRVAVGGATIDVSVSGSAHVSKVRNPATLEERVRHLEEDVLALRSELQQAREQHERNLPLLRTTVREHKEALGKDIRNIREELREAAVGGINTDYLWSVLLLFGLILTNYNEHMSKWFK